MPVLKAAYVGVSAAIIVALFHTSQVVYGLPSGATKVLSALSGGILVGWMLEDIEDCIQALIFMLTALTMIVATALMLPVSLGLVPIREFANLYVSLVEGEVFINILIASLPAFIGTIMGQMLTEKMQRR